VGAVRHLRRDPHRRYRVHRGGGFGKPAVGCAPETPEGRRRRPSACRC